MAIAERTDSAAPAAALAPPQPEPKPRSKRWTATRVKWLVLAMVLAAAYEAVSLASVQVVTLITPRWTQSVETLATAGIVEGRVETTLGADTQGTLVDLYVDENSHVKGGQLLAKVQNRTADSQIAQGAAALARARAQLRQAKTGPSPEEISAAEARVRQADETIEGARATLERARIGASQADSALRDSANPIERSKANLDQAWSRRELAEKTLTRTRRLVSEGAIAAARLDDAQAAFDIAVASVADAKSAVDSAENASRVARLATQDAIVAVTAAESGVRAARAVREAAAAELSNLRALPRAEGVSVAQSGVSEAEAALDSARTLARNAEIRAPFDGTVTRLLCQRGAAVGVAGVMRLVETGSLEAKAEVDESNLEQLRVGQRVVLTTSSDPERQIQGKIIRISSHVDSSSGTVEIVTVPTEKANLRAGQTVDLNVIVNEKIRRLLVPTSAVRRMGDETLLFVLENGRAKSRPVRTGQSSGREIAILEGITEKDRVIRDGVNLEDGKRVRAGK